MVEAIVQRPELSSLGGHRYGVLRLPSVKEEAPKPCVRYLATAEIRSPYPFTVLCKAGGDIFFGNAAARHHRSLKVRQSPFEIGSNERGNGTIQHPRAPGREPVVRIAIEDDRAVVSHAGLASRPSSCSRLAMARRTGSTRSVCHARFVAPGPPPQLPCSTWPPTRLTSDCLDSGRVNQSRTAAR